MKKRMTAKISPEKSVISSEEDSLKQENSSLDEELHKNENTGSPSEENGPAKGSKEEAYEWLYRHHVTVRIMDIVIAVCIIFLIIVVFLGMRK